MVRVVGREGGPVLPPLPVMDDPPAPVLVVILLEAEDSPGRLFVLDASAPLLPEAAAEPSDVVPVADAVLVPEDAAAVPEVAVGIATLPVLEIVGRLVDCASTVEAPSMVARRKAAAGIRRACNSRIASELCRSRPPSSHHGITIEGTGSVDTSSS